MNKKIFMMTFILMLFLFVGLGSAYEQTVEISTSRPVGNEEINENTTWEVFETFEMTIGDEINSIKIIRLKDIANDEKSAIFSVVNYGTIETIYLSKDESVIIDDLTLTLLDISEGSSTANVATDGNPISVWIEPSVGDKKYLIVNGINTFNPVDYGSDSGWTTTYEKEEVILHAERLESVNVAFDMESNGIWESEEKNNLIKFYLKSNAEYKFIVDYTEIGLWGGETETTDIYVISISGLGETSISTSPNDNTEVNVNSDDSEPIVKGDYRLNVGDSKNIITDEDGEWTLDTGYAINPNIANEKYVWTFEFSQEGNYRPEFISDSGKTGFVDFNIKPKEVSANTVQGTDNPSNAGKVVALLGLIFIVIGGFIFMQKNKGSKFSMKKSDSSSSVSPVEKEFV